MKIKEAEFYALIELVNTMMAKFELYEKYEHAREKEFRELEREVYRLKNERDRMSQVRISEARAYRGQAEFDDMAGVAWLR